ncbi:MAG: hypothetical protein WCP08_12340 [Prolixibacteraceae bacterium]
MGTLILLPTRIRIYVLLGIVGSGVNMIGNCLATTVIARWEGEFDDEKANG